MEADVKTLALEDVGTEWIWGLGKNFLLDDWQDGDIVQEKRSCRRWG
jgi:hypothetical protein